MLPPLYDDWVRTLLGGDLPDESEATCQSCVMMPAPARPKSLPVFNIATKCCTYLPVIPNYLVGAILTEPAGAGRDSVVARLRAGIAVTPLGLGRSRAYGLLYDHGEDVFGHARGLRCPHYLADEGGDCGIWRQRNATCATWFCRHVRGALGHRFWTTIHQLLDEIEHALTRWCVLEADLDLRTLGWLFPSPRLANSAQKAGPEDIDGVRDEAAYAGIWGAFAGREEEFYQSCAERVSILDWKDLLKLGGPDVHAAARLAKGMYHEHQAAELPDRLTVGTLHILATDEDHSFVESYSPYDITEVPHELQDVLRFFDGRTVPEAVRAAAESGVEIGASLLRKLVDLKIFGVRGKNPRANAYHRNRMLAEATRYFTWLGSIAPTLQPHRPATAKALAQLERQLGRKLPAELRALLQVADGQAEHAEAGAIYGLEFLSARAIAAEWKTWADLRRTEDLAELDEPQVSLQPGKIQPRYTLPGWIPLFRFPGSADYLGMDLEPGKKGRVGQIINFGRDQEVKYVAAPDLTAFFAILNGWAAVESKATVARHAAACAHIEELFGRASIPFERFSALATGKKPKLEKVPADAAPAAPMVATAIPAGLEAATEALIQAVRVCVEKYGRRARFVKIENECREGNLFGNHAQIASRASGPWQVMSDWPLQQAVYALQAAIIARGLEPMRFQLSAAGGECTMRFESTG